MLKYQPAILCKLACLSLVFKLNVEAKQIRHVALVFHSNNSNNNNNPYNDDNNNNSNNSSTHRNNSSNNTIVIILIIISSKNGSCFISGPGCDLGEGQAKRYIDINIYTHYMCIYIYIYMYIYM